MVMAFAVVVGLLYDYFFDLNDDVLMKDILSGAFTSMPEAHNIQMLYPISYVISRFYKLARSVDWYGLFLLICQYFSVTVLIVHFSEKKLLRKAGLLLFFSGFLMGHLVIVQYTFTVALLCATAAILFAEKKDVAAAVLVTIAFLIRSEMTLLMLPFVLLVLFYRFMDEKKDIGVIRKYSVLMASIALCLVVSELIHFAGYSSKEWREFTSFFNSRTDIYDFYQIPDYAEHKDFYDSIGMRESEYELLVNYNFGIDEDIDAQRMRAIADYAASIRHERGLAEKVKDVLPEYLYRLRSIGLPKSFEYPMTDAPWNIVTLLLYLFVIVLHLMNGAAGTSMTRRLGDIIWRLAILFGGRTLLWMYILVRGRDPIRITHSLYLLEIIVLMLLMEKGISVGKTTDSDNERTSAVESKPNGSEDSANTGGIDRSNLTVTRLGVSFSVILLLVGVAYIPFQANITRTECEGRQEYNKPYQELEKYFRDHNRNFYYMDVYTSVAYEDNGYTYSQKMFGETDNRAVNWTLLGGWASKSPAEKSKMRYFELEPTVEESILLDKVYLVSDKDTDVDWVKAYFADKSMPVSVDKVEDVAGEFTVYAVRYGE